MGSIIGTAANSLVETPDDSMLVTRLVGLLLYCSRNANVAVHYFLF